MLPSNEHPPDTTDKSLRNLVYPLDWDEIFDYVGFPAFLKPFAGGGWKNVYRLDNPRRVLPRLQRDRPARHDAAGRDRLQGVLPLLLHRPATSASCSTTRGSRPRRYVRGGPPIQAALYAQVEDDCLTLNRALGYDFNTVEFAVRDGVPYAIDFCNPAPDADVKSVGEDNFEWVVENAANMAIRRAQNHVRRQEQPRWGGVRQHLRALNGSKTMSDSRSCSRSGSRKSSRSSTRRRASSARTSSELLAEGQELLKESVKPEMHQSVVEVGTRHLPRHQGGAQRGRAPAHRARRARAANGLRIAAAGTHPFSRLAGPAHHPASALRQRSSRTCRRWRART